MEDILLDWLAKGWRISIKTHLVPASWAANFPYKDEDGDGIGFVAHGYSYGKKREQVGNHDAWRGGGVAPTPSQALSDLIKSLEQIEERHAI